ncbi:MAG: serine hydrolase, partial [Saprospiraceae bacterium]|nr:serine hydrolase [Saprospiraceae bacterium]
MSFLVVIPLTALLSFPLTITGQESDFSWSLANPESQGFSSSMLNSLRDSLIVKGTKKLMIIKNDKLVYEWYEDGWEDSVRTHYSASLAKALVGGMSLLVSLHEGWLFPDMPVCHLIPQWQKDGAKSKITIRHLATHTSGMEDAEVKEEKQQIMRREGLHPHMDLPGWKGQFWRQDVNPFIVSRDSTHLLSIPGTHFNYSNPGIAMLSYAVTAASQANGYRDIPALLWQRAYSPLGIENKEISIGYKKTFTTDGLSLVQSWGGGAFTANAAARIGRLMLHQGSWQNNQILDSKWIKRVTNYTHTAIPGEDSSQVSELYSLRSENNTYPATTMGWYSNFDGVWNHVPKDAFAGAGAGHQLLLVVPSLNLIVVRFGADLADT